MMQLIDLEAAILFVIAISQISSISISSPAPDCLAAVDICMSDLCKSEDEFYRGICEDDGCKIKGSEDCNMTIQTILDQFPPLQGCVCSWEEELCGSIQVLATQCHRKPVYDGAGSCWDQIRVCVNDAVCNRYLLPVLQACMENQCDEEHCQHVTRQFYVNLPQNVAEMLVMCKCEASDQSCVHMKTGLQSGTCGGETWICQDALTQCFVDKNCRDLLKTFQAKCWSPEEAQCSNSDLQSDECFTQLNPALILGGDSECKMAFLGTLGTVLHHPCTCEGVHYDDLRICNIIHDVLHNRSHFMTSWKNNGEPSKLPEINESEQARTWSHDYLLYTFATMLLIGVVTLISVALLVWVLRRRDKTKFHHPEKKHCVVIS